MRYRMLFIVLLAILLVGCTAEQSVEESTSPTPPIVEESSVQEAVEPPNEQDVFGSDSVVVMSDMEFRPHSLTIKAGERVEFVNRDDLTHTATGDSWDTDMMTKGQSEFIQFDEPGTYEYVCLFHPGMRGEIIVE